MRNFLILLVIASAGAAWWWVDRDQAAERTQVIEKAQLASAETGVRRMLAQSDIFEFSAIVVGPRLEDGGWDFRGLLRRDGNFRPAYGRAALICEDGFEAAECWTIGYLEADGKEVPLGAEAQVPDTASQIAVPAADLPLTSATPSPSPTATPESPPPGAEEGSGTQTPAAGDPPAAAAVANPQASTEPVVVADPQPPAAEVPQATHRVARARINTRSGPGTENPIITTLSAGTLLALIETEGSWGRFLILDGAATGTEVWSALSIVEGIEP